jgi:hypothetical protein
VKYTLVMLGKFGGRQWLGTYNTEAAVVKADKAYRRVHPWSHTMIEHEKEQGE